MGRMGNSQVGSGLERVLYPRREGAFKTGPLGVYPEVYPGKLIASCPEAEEAATSRRRIFCRPFRADPLKYKPRLKPGLCFHGPSGRGYSNNSEARKSVTHESRPEIRSS